MTSWSDYECLHPEVVHAMLEKQLTKPTHIQAEVFQHYHHYHDFLVAAQTGSGKTLAFGAPIISELLHLKQHLAMPRLPQCLIGLVLTPTRELAQQIESSFIMALEKTNLNKAPVDQVKVACIIGGMSKEKQVRILQQKRPHIIIGTPGRLHDLLGEKILNFKNLKHLVIDEADRMIEMGHFKEIDEILEQIFEPKLKEVFDKDYEQASKMIDKKNRMAGEEFYVKENGKKIKLNLSINAIPTDQAFEVPNNMFTFADPHFQDKADKDQKGKKGKSVPKERETVDLPLTHDETIFLSKLKRRIFFISATLTREFKGSRYFIKKPRSEKDWEDKKKDQKLKRKEKDKEVHGKGNKEEEKKDELQDAIPKLKALISRAKFSAKPKIIDQSSLLFLPEGLKEIVTFTEGDLQRITYIISYLKELPAGSKIIIFSNTIKSCKRIQFFVESFGMENVSLHSHMQQKQRLKKLEKFKKSKICNILIATDVAARGLDFNISHVIQMGVPVNGDTYVHRAGRTARANRKGEALIVVDRKESNRWVDINDTISQTAPDRKVTKYVPTEELYDQMMEKAEKFDWIRRNTEKNEGRITKNDRMDADQLGMDVEEEGPRKKYDYDREEEALVRHMVKKTTQGIRNQFKSKKTTVVQENQQQKWRKNKLVLSMEEIKRML